MVCKKAISEILGEKQWDNLQPWNNKTHNIELPKRLVEAANVASSSFTSEKQDYSYDAIIVDEGQDFQISWWQALRNFLSDNGEMVLAADPTQDLYGTASNWTDEAMVGAGFSGLGAC